MYKIDFKKFLPGIAWFFVVLILMCLPGEDIPPSDWLNIDFLDKWLHAGVFGLLVFLFCWPFYKSAFGKDERKHYFIKIALATSIWGLAIEFIQKFFIPGRSFDLFDWAADSVGALLGFFICFYLFIKKEKTFG
ncbi:MAG: VanZ family protein [Ginsengibacter sp.]